MITVIYGLPGSGKGYYLARATQAAIRNKRRVYATCAMHAARPLKTIVDCLAPLKDPNSKFAGCLMVVDEAGSYFDARMTLKNPLPRLAFSALTLHRKGGIDILMACQSIQFLDVQVRRVTGQYIRMQRVGADATARLVAGKAPGLPYFHRPVGFWATAYAPDKFNDKMELLGTPEPEWRTFMWWKRSSAESFDTSERVINPEDEDALDEWLAGSPARADAEPFIVQKGKVVRKHEDLMPLPQLQPTKGLVF